MCISTPQQGEAASSVSDISNNNVSKLPWPEDSSRSESSGCKSIGQSIWSIYNRWTFHYMNRIFSKGALQKHDKSIEAQLTPNDLYQTPREEQAGLLNTKFWEVYNEQKKQANTDNYNRFLRTLWILVKHTFVPAGMCQLVALSAQLSFPMCVMKLLQAVEQSQDGNIIEETIPYVIAIFLLSITNALFTHRYQLLSYQSGIVIRTAVTCAIYEQSLKLSPQGRSGGGGLTSGNVTNLVATDTQKLFEVMHEAHQIWSCPLAILVVVVLLFVIIGPSCLVGAFILIGLVPLSKKVAHIIVKIRKKRVAVADERIEIVSAMLQDIKITKLNNYEDQFEKRVQDARRREMALVKKEQSVWGLTLVIRVFTPVLASFFTFATYVLASEDNIMTASIVFTLALLFNMLKFPINQAGQLLSKAALGIQAAHRIHQFMERERVSDDAEAAPNLGDQDESEIVLKVQNGTFHVGTFHVGTADSNQQCATVESNQVNASFTLSGININVKRGEILAIVGRVASGKSTLIQGLLGDVQSSADTKISMSKGCTTSYAAQTPFILSTTVRENILFGSAFDKDRYEKVLDACCLRQDLLQWPAGDLTEIGERGVTMSGGQKQRVSVARAVYSNADLGLFDDILSALDAGTSQILFDNLFGSIHDDFGLLHKCGVVLVTHAQHVLQRVDNILVLDDGCVVFYGSWKELQTFEAENARHRATLQSMQSSLQLNGKDNIIDSSETSRNSTTKTSQPSMVANDKDKSKGEITQVEQRVHGVSSIEIWLLWFKYAGGLLFISVQVFLMACDRGSYVAIDWWLATWTSSAGQSIVIFGREFPNQYDGIHAQISYLVIYAIIVLCMLLFLVLRSQWAVFGGIRACRRVFSNMTHRVLHAPMSYFDCTPLGRVLNRFTYDVEQVDITLAQFMSIFIIASSWLIAGQVVMIAIVPYMAGLNAIVLALYVMVLRHYRWSASDLQRLDAVSRSPIQASLAEGLDGSFTIRAFGKINYFAEAFHTYINDNSSAMLNFVASRRWLAVRLETLGAFVTLGASLAITLFNNQLGLTPGLSGLLLMWASSMTVTLGFLINAFSEVEAAITSIERMHSMELLPQEASMLTSKEYEVDSYWPQKGTLAFDNVHLRYRPGLPLSLEGLSFTLEHGQRCALVGRTGAGKSTITAALFRLVEIEKGTIKLNGIDLSTLGLSDVRGRRNGMFILPQDPAVFAGTIQSNLDPFNSHNNEDIMNALMLVKFPGVEVLGEKLMTQTVDEGGSNLSAGEKQLLCLARAMLANPRLLVLDEATSAVDRATDEFVQKMLRSQFPNTTLLTIAHRLETIIDYDKIIVMDKGKVAEMGSPRELLQDESGLFTAMVEATGPESAMQLREVAK